MENFSKLLSGFLSSLVFYSIVTLTVDQQLEPDMHWGTSSTEEVFGTSDNRLVFYPWGVDIPSLHHVFHALLWGMAFWTSACLSFSSLGFKNWWMIFLEQALGILKEATWTYCIVFCHFQNTDWTLIGWGRVWELPLFFFFSFYFKTIFH